MAKSNKKNNQEEKNQDAENTELDLMPVCSHLAKALSLPHLRKAINNGELSDLSICKDCSKEAREKDVEDEKDKNPIDDGFSEFLSEDDLATIKAIYVCLQCGNRGCSRSTENQHSLKHQNTARSLSHDVAVNCYTWNVWCYRCDEFINPNQTKPLTQAIQMLQNAQSKSAKRNNTKEFQQAPTQAAESPVQEDKAEDCEESPKSEDGSVKVKILKVPCEDLKRPKGLQNLGNTCFFNSVMQNLGQTHLLTDACLGTVKDEVKWTVQPLGKSSIIKDMKTLELSLGECGELTIALSEVFKEMLFGSKEVFSPGSLFHQICMKSPQFRGYQQQDSHELLRHLFEGVFTEESKRMKSAILQNFGLKKSVSPNNVKSHIRQQIDAYKKQTHHTFLETVFGGLLINTILCLKCRKSSQNFEPFVDLSLPIVEPKRNRSQVPRRSDPVMDDIEEMYGKAKKEGPSKHQQKSAKKQKRKQRNKAKKQNQLESSTKESTPESISSQTENGDLSGSEREESPSESDEVKENRANEKLEETGGVDSILSKVTEIGINQRRRGSDENQSEVDSGIDFICPDDEEDHLLQTHKDVWKELSLSTLGDRTACTAVPTTADHSVATCLAAFTEEELLTGKNKFGCDFCTEEHGKPGKGGKKERVYTDAQMQLLVLIPPAILTLHLKRFMQYGMRLQKNGVKVSFPKILDLAPYCSKACVNLPSMKPGQTKILYSLYGVVEHSGGLHGGHYTAYVKTRPNTKHGEQFLQPLPLKMGLDDLIREMHKRCEKQAAMPEANNAPAEEENAEEELVVPEGRWYYISDSSVRQATETSALTAEAYILFYERMT